MQALVRLGAARAEENYMGKQRPIRRRPGRNAAGGQWIYIWGAAVALALVAALILLGALSGGDGGGNFGPVVAPTARPATVPRDGAVYGNPNATVTVTEYLDFQCPVCLRAGLTVLLEIEQNYVESGKANLEVVPIAILGDESVAAAEAAQCAQDQGRFWEYHDILFANQGAENDGGFSADRLKSFAATIGLDTTAFDTCLDSGGYESDVKARTAASKDLGVKGTPTVFVNGQKVETSVDAIAAAIDRALAGGS